MQLPVIALFIIGPERMTAFTNAIPEWLIGGFRVAGGLLPVVGIAILMRFMNAKNDLAYLLFGFALVSFLNVSNDRYRYLWGRSRFIGI